MPTLMLVDDDPAIRELLREFVPLCCPQLTVAGEADNGQAAVEMAKRLRPDIALIDVRMPILDGIQATRQIKQVAQLDTVVITFTSYEWPELEAEAKAAGARYHLCKPFKLEELRNTLLKAAGL